MKRPRRYHVCMVDKRIEPRLLCADLVDLCWKDKTGRTKRSVANLEDISLSGACLQVDHPVPMKTAVKITHANGDLLGIVKYCVFRDIGYFLGIEFESGSRWSLRAYKPQHLLDPRRLVLRTIQRVTRPEAPPSSFVN